MKKEVYVRMKGDFCCMNTYCSTLKEFMDNTKFKRSEIAEWWKQ